MRKSKEFRQLQQLVMTKQKRGLAIKSTLEKMMEVYIETSRLNREQLDEIASEIENELKGDKTNG